MLHRSTNLLKLNCKIHLPTRMTPVLSDPMSAGWHPSSSIIPKTMTWVEITPWLKVRKADLSRPCPTFCWPIQLFQHPSYVNLVVLLHHTTSSFAPSRQEPKILRAWAVFVTSILKYEQCCSFLRMKGSGWTMSVKNRCWSLDWIQVQVIKTLILRSEGEPCAFSQCSLFQYLNNITIFPVTLTKPGCLHITIKTSRTSALSE